MKRIYIKFSFVVFLVFLLSLIGQKALAVQSRTLYFPGEETWYVCRGYNVASHTGNQKYSLDLTTDPNSKGTSGCIGNKSAATGKKVYAPADGKVVHYGTNNDFILLKLKSGGCFQIGHLGSRVENYKEVSQGEYLGTVAGPSSSNGNYAHLHFSAFPVSCWKDPVPFSEGSNFRISELPNLPATSTTNAYSGKATCVDKYRAEYFNGRDWSNKRGFSQCENWPINWDWGENGPGNGIGNDNFSARWTGKASFSTGYYTFIARTDDGMRVWLDGKNILDKWIDQSPTQYNVFRKVNSGNHSVKVEYYENGGGAVAQFRWVKSSGNLALNRATWATSKESSSYSPYKGNDGDTATRWSSASTGQDEWWKVDLGSTQTFDKVIIRWEAAYAAEHFVGWSSDNNTFYGYWFTIPSAGSYIYSPGTRTDRYLAVVMRTRAPCCGNFSFWEFEVYRSNAALSSRILKEVMPLTPISEIEVIQFPPGSVSIENPEFPAEIQTPTGQ